MALVRLNSGSITADEEFLEALVALKLDTMGNVTAYGGPGRWRTHANRENFHIVETVGSRTYDFHFKRHRGFELKEAVKFLMTRSPLETAGRREWENIFRLQGLNIPSMRPVAFGEKKLLFLERRSFIITQAIPNAAPMDDYVREHYAGALEAEAEREKRALLWEVGDLVRRLHNAGLTHMDLYLNHFFVRETPEGDKVLHLIDLQRVAKRWAFKRRWLVKDLAALVYSTRNLPLSRNDIARIFSAYFDGVLTPANRGLLRAALKRARRMMSRT